MRKVIQISQAGATNGYTLVALCNDGTMWAASHLPWMPSTWERLAPIPQDTPTPHAGGTDA